MKKTIAAALTAVSTVAFAVPALAEETESDPVHECVTDKLDEQLVGLEEQAEAYNKRAKGMPLPEGMFDSQQPAIYRTMLIRECEESTGATATEQTTNMREYSHGEGLPAIKFGH